jgi:hypothetical protein
MSKNNQTTEPKVENLLTNQELFDQILSKIKENLDIDVLAKSKSQEQADFILREQTTYLKTYLKL